MRKLKEYKQKKIENEAKNKKEIAKRPPFRTGIVLHTVSANFDFANNKAAGGQASTNTPMFKTPSSTSQHRRRVFVFGPGVSGPSTNKAQSKMVKAHVLWL